MRVSWVRAVGVLTGWGEGIGAWPGEARVAAGGRRVIVAAPPPHASERLRRATRECLLGVAAVDALVAEAGSVRAQLAGDGTALLYVTAAAYGASNRAFIEGGGALHFPYTAPSAVPAEVAIEFGMHGPQLVLIGGATATVAALRHAATLLERGACARAVVLAVETFAECEDLHARARWLLGAPLVETAVAALLEPGSDEGADVDDDVPSVTAEVRRRVGETLAAEPLLALALARSTRAGRVMLEGRWRGHRAAVAVAARGARAS